MSKRFEEEKIKKNADLSNLKFLMSYTKPYTKHLLIAVLLLFAITLANLLQPYVIQRVLDDYLNPGKVEIMTAAKGFNYAGKTLRIGKANADAEENYVENRSSEDDDFSEELTVLNINGEEHLLNDEEKQNFNDYRFGELTRSVLIFFSLILLGLFATYLQQNTLNYVGQKVIFQIRSELFNHLQRLDLPFFEINPTGRLVTRMTNDLENINELYTNVIVTFLMDVGLIVGSIVVMLGMNTRLALWCLIVTPPLAVITYIFRIKVREAYRVVRAKLSKINAALNENFMGVKTIQIFNQEEKFIDEFEDINEEYRLAAREELKLYAIFRPIINFMYYVSLFLAVLIGGKMVMEGEMKIGVIIAMTMYISKLFRPIQDLAEKFNILQSSLTSIERVALLFKEKPVVIDHEAVDVEKFQGKVEFDNVRFSYNEGEEILKGISFSAEPGETIAFVGATGAGKSTIIKLLSRLYDVDSGEIRIDGRNIKEYDKYQLRKRISAVLQDVFLFSGDIRNNIKLLSKDVDDAEILKAARLVNADKFINKHAAGLDHEVTESGSTFSAGERQLLSFARALVHKPDILILDEATASIDTETEELIQEAIENLVKDRTTFVVAHRLSTIRNADKIIVMHKGKIAESGTHEELLNKKGLYYDLYRLQYE